MSGRSRTSDQTHQETGELTGEYHGHEGVKTFFRAWMGPFESFHAHAEEFIEVGEAVVVRARQGGRGKQSGVEVEMPSYWAVYRVEAGLVSRITVYLNEADALNAARLKG